MEIKTVAQLDEYGVFIGYVDLDDTDKNPLEEGEWMIPNGCIETLPEEDIPEGYVAIWVDGEYLIESYDTLKHAKDTLSEEAKIAAIKMEEDAASYAREIRDGMLSKTDWTQLPDVPKKVRDAYKPYRKALRDVTKSKGWPFNFEWPTPPEV